MNILPRQARDKHRENSEKRQTVFLQHIGAHAWVDHDHGETYEWHYTSLTFYTSEKFVKRYGHGAPEPVKLQVPEDDSPSTFGARNKSGGSFPNVPCVVVPSLSWQMIFHFVW